MYGSSSRVSCLCWLGAVYVNLDIDSRRAVFHIGNKTYSSKLVDLPCIIESQKTLDNKQMFKVADICQVCLSSRPHPSPERTKLFTRCLLWMKRKLARASSLTGAHLMWMSSSGTMALLHLLNMPVNVVSANERAAGYVLTAEILYSYSDPLQRSYCDPAG